MIIQVLFVDFNICVYTVCRSVYGKFLEAAAAELVGYKLGDPLDSKTNLGPMALPAAQDFLQAQVVDAVTKGARVLVGGSKTTDGISGKSRFFQVRCPYFVLSTSWQFPTCVPQLIIMM